MSISKNAIKLAVFLVNVLLLETLWDLGETDEETIKLLQYTGM